MQSKADLRLILKERLACLSKESCLTAAEEVATQLVNSEVFASSKTVACYLPIGNELDTALIINQIWRQAKICYLPVILATREMQFVSFSAVDKLVATKYGGLEPIVTTEKLIEPQKLDLVIVPLLGFNSRGFRLGRGAGFYDRTFDFKKLLPQSKAKPYLLGVGYNIQLVEFEPDPWDIALDEIIISYSLITCD